MERISFNHFTKTEKYFKSPEENSQNYLMLPEDGWSYTKEPKAPSPPKKLTKNDEHLLATYWG